jgi:type I restriction enzyme, S subunit
MNELPPGWSSAELGEVAHSVTNGIFISRPAAVPNGVPILRISAVRELHLNMDDLRYSGMSAGTLQAADRLLHEGDLLFTRYSGTPRFVGVCAVIPRGIGPLTFPDKLIRVRVDKEVIYPRYAAFCLAAPDIRRQITPLMKTTAGQVGISGTSIKRIRLPVPPLAEQCRIVEALEDHLSRLDVASDHLRRAKSQCCLA